MGFKKSIMTTAAMLGVAAQGGANVFDRYKGSILSKDYSTHTLTPKQKKARKRNKAAAKSRAKNRRK